MEKLYNIYYGENENEYIRRYLKDDEIINGYLTEAKAFEIFFDNMIMCNNYFNNNDFTSIDELISAYDEEDDTYIDEYQMFIIDITYDEELTIKAIKKMGNTFYYDNEKELYLTGITDLGTSRRLVSTNIKVTEVK